MEPDAALARRDATGLEVANGRAFCAPTGCLRRPAVAVAADRAGRSRCEKRPRAPSLAPADTSSPRATLLSFNANITKALELWRAGEPRETALRYARLAFETFDFSQLPSEERLAREIETALFLKEILDRIELPAADDIPGAREVAAAENTPDRWTIPYTNIAIAKMKAGPRSGEYLFTAETVDKLEEFYERAKDLPYKPGALVGIRDEFLYSPGSIVPSSWARAIPAWSRSVVLGKAQWQWLVLASTLIAAFVAIRSILRWGRRWDKRHDEAQALIRFGTPLSIIAGVVVLSAVGFVLLYVAKFVGEAGEILSTVLWALIFAGAGWLIVIITGLIADAINEARRVKEGSIDGQLVRTVLRLVSLVVLVFLIIYAASFFGIPLTPVIASLGVGGLAIALAVRPTLENIIGGLTLFADKPVRIGDYCRFGDGFGTVEAIGLRSTRLRKRDDTLVIVPNADFSQRELTNYTRRRQRLFQTTLGLRYETTAQQLRYVLAKLRDMLLGHPMVSPDKLHARFGGFGAYSLDIEIFAYIRTADWLEYLAVREDINLRIIDIINDAGTGFAFPSQTAYLGRDTGLDVERSRRAEAAVEEWRSKGQLPFPEIDPQLRWEKEDILDYPPRGSPAYTPRPGATEPRPEPPAAPAPPPAERWTRFVRRGRA